MSKENEVLYVGKAKNLKNRLRSYTDLKRLSPRIKQMVLAANKLKFQELSSELEALLIEAELIRAHQPPYNVLLKDDKSPIYIYITDEKFPKVKTLRKTDLLKLKPKQRGYLGISLGPFTSAYKLKQVLILARKIFKWCDQKTQGQACFYRHINLCSGACTGEISEAQYKQNIKNLILFLKDQKKELIKKLMSEMQVLSDLEKFEEAQIKKEQIENIIAITSMAKLKPDLTLPQLKNKKSEEALLQLRKILSDFMGLPKNFKLERIEGYDVSNTSGQQASVSMVVFTNGLADKKEYRLFNIKTLDTPNDYQMMKEAVSRRQNNPHWGQPDLLVIDGGRGQLRAAYSVWQWRSPVVSLVKNPDRLVIPIIQNHHAQSSSLGQAGKIINYKIIKFEDSSPVLHLLQEIRNESHRFSKKQHSRRRLKKLFE